MDNKYILKRWYNPLDDADPPFWFIPRKERNSRVFNIVSTFYSLKINSTQLSNSDNFMKDVECIVQGCLNFAVTEFEQSEGKPARRARCILTSHNREVSPINLPYMTMDEFTAEKIFTHIENNAPLYGDIIMGVNILFHFQFLI